jgi:hypothetical protein
MHLRWDLDKTYLQTNFDTVKDLVKTFWQKPEDKVSVVGAQALLRALLDPADRSNRRVTFISGSPRQMRRVLMKKLELDGVEPDMFILKPNLENLLRGRFRAIRGQVGYKLKSLLLSHMADETVDEYLFGDDAEQDAFIYSLYADILSGKVDAVRMAAILTDLQGLPPRRRRDHGLPQASSPAPATSCAGSSSTSTAAPRSTASPPTGPRRRHLQLLPGRRAPVRRRHPRRPAAARRPRRHGRRRLHPRARRQLGAGPDAPRLRPAPAIRKLTDALALQSFDRAAWHFAHKFEDVVTSMDHLQRSPPPWPDEINYLGLYHEARWRRQQQRLLGIRLLD